MRGVCVLGIDPGLGGGLALIHPRDGILLESMPTIGNELDLKTLNDFISAHADDVLIAYLEKATAMPKQGVTSMFKFGRVFGTIEAMLAAYEIPMKIIPPQQWMKIMHVGLSRSLGTKERSQIVFDRLFPDIDARRTPKCKGPDMGLVEAALIAQYGLKDTI